MQGWWRRGGRFPRAAGSALAGLLAVLALAVAQAKPKHENVHTPSADCGGCHTADRAQLQGDPATAKSAVVSDIDARCNACHADEGPSHRTGFPPRAPVPSTLPLSEHGDIMCATCHFTHGEANPFGDFVRIDNSRGALCLTCHTLAELH